MFETHVPRVFCQWDNVAQSLYEVDFWKFQWFFIEIMRLFCLFICWMLGLFISYLLGDHGVSGVFAQNRLLSCFQGL